MRTDDAVLERILSDADPARTPRDAAPDARALATRDRILRSSREPRRAHARTLGWASGLTAVAASAALAFALLVPQGAAVAETPRPLIFDDAGTLAQTFEGAAAELAAAPGPSAPERVVRTASWSFSIDADLGSAEIVPQLSAFVWSEDLSGDVTIIEGVAYDPSDAVAHSDAEVTSSGEVVSEESFGPGEFSTPVPQIPGETASEVTTLLQAFGMPEQPTSFDVVTALTSVFGQWTLTNTQHAEVLALIEEAGGAQALGSSTDRLGRAVAGVRVIGADGAVSDDLLISLETGRIVGVERTVLVDDGLVLNTW